MPLRKKIKHIIYKINYKVFMKNTILMESNPDYADNTKAVFDELIRQKINEKYHIVWFVGDEKKFSDIKIENVKFYSRAKNKFNKYRFKYYNLLSKYIIDCNKSIKKMNKNQFRIHLTHGTPIKLARDYCKGVGDFDYVIQISDYFTEITADLFKVDKSKIITTGFPRNDYLFNDYSSKFNIYPEIARKKTIVWFPTYRNHKSAKGNSIYDMGIDFPYGVPAINNEKELQMVNKALLDNDILLLVKLHPVEDKSKIQNLNLSNIKLIDDTIFDENHTNLYQFFSISDALITDYSSVYYDYLLTGKSVGLAISDIEEYKKHVELLFDNFEDNIAGEYIYNYNDLIKFIENVAKNNDIMMRERTEKTNLYHKYFDGNSSKRVVDILKKRMEEEKKI